jgi:hypothetical protein
MSVHSPGRVREAADGNGQRPCMPCYQYVHLITGLRSLDSTGVKAVMIPPAIPRERLRRTARTHRPGRGSHQILIFGDCHLHSILLSMRPTTTSHPFAAASSCRRSPTTSSPALSQEPISRRLVLGGLINEYEQAGYKPWSKAVAEFWHPQGSSPPRCLRSAKPRQTSDTPQDDGE